MTIAPPLRRLRFERLRSGRRKNVLFITSVVILAFFAIGAVLAPYLAPYDPDAIDLMNPYSGFSAAHLLGTDASGRDTLSRVMWGARISLTAPLIVAVVVTIIGSALGLLAAWLGGAVDWMLSRAFDILFSFPALLLAILSVALFGKGLTAPIVAMIIAYTPYVALLVRNLVLTERSRPYVSAYRVQGFGGFTVATRRVLPNVSPIILAQSTLNFGYVLMDLAALSFLGLGVQPPTADWGSMINDASAAVLANQPLPALIPAIAIVLVVVSVNVIGEELSDRLAGRSTR